MTPTIPPTLSTPAFMEAWEGWLESRAKAKKLPTPRGQMLWLKRLEAWGHDKAIEALDNSTMNRWSGLWLVQDAPSGPAPRPAAFSMWELTKQLEAVEAEARDIHGRGTQHPMGWEAASVADKERLRVLRGEQRRLRSAMQPAALQQPRP